MTIMTVEIIIEYFNTVRHFTYIIMIIEFALTLKETNRIIEHEKKFCYQALCKTNHFAILYIKFC